MVEEWGRNVACRSGVAARLFLILDAFTARQPQLNLAQLTARTGLPHATAFRLVSELVRWGGLMRHADGTYSVGLRLWEIGTLSPRSVPLRQLAMPVMEDLFWAVNQHVQLGVLEGTEAVVVERISTENAVELISRVGGRLPLHATGVGKILLAHAPDELVASVLSRPLTRYTPHTIVDPGRLRAVLAEVRRTGVAVVKDEMTADAQSVATKVTGPRGEVVAALSVVTRTDSVSVGALTHAVVTAGRAISRKVCEIPQIGPAEPE
ncbi:IclR family transcriptional regulator [Saccharopolyspora shandongensis]|uniref:IclR family transcriptional regulator n=1 Tax=Saccharopolyspora shandongensis TaxID=418495 RepID=UPI0033CDC125